MGKRRLGGNERTTFVVLDRYFRFFRGREGRKLWGEGIRSGQRRREVNAVIKRCDRDTRNTGKREWEGRGKFAAVIQIVEFV